VFLLAYPAASRGEYALGRIQAGNAAAGVCVAGPGHCSAEWMRAAMKRILIVDDESFLLDGLEKALKTDSTDVMTVETGNSALQEIAASPYQLCFLDLFLPDVNGVDVLKKIKEFSPKTKVIVMTAGVVTQSMQENIEKDAYMFITKPFDLLQVKMLTRRILEETA
jgi:DNA-binding NtrC family response regulator